MRDARQGEVAGELRALIAGRRAAREDLDHDHRLRDLDRVDLDPPAAVDHSVRLEGGVRGDADDRPVLRDVARDPGVADRALQGRRRHALRLRMSRPLGPFLDELAFEKLPAPFAPIHPMEEFVYGHERVRVVGIDQGLRNGSDDAAVPPAPIGSGRMSPTVVPSDRSSGKAFPVDLFTIVPDNGKPALAL